MLDVLADYLSMRGWNFGRLDGRMSLEERAKDMEQFRNDPDTPVFLISTRAGGLGVNLTAADTVIIYDSDWVYTVGSLCSIASNQNVFVCDRTLSATCKHKIVAIVLVKRDLLSFIDLSLLIP